MGPSLRKTGRVAALAAIPLALWLLSSSWLSSEDSLFEEEVISVVPPPPPTPPEAKIYVYSLPDSLEGDIVADTNGDWGEYNADIWVREALLASDRRVARPEDADLFFIPALPTRYFHARFRQATYAEALEASTDYVRRVIHHVSTAHPHWNRTAGRDHFMTLAHDHGRCTHFSGIGKDVTKEMFVLQHHGDLWAHIGSGKTYQRACYEPDRDVLLPAYMKGVEIASPLEGERPINVLYRFKGDDDKDPFRGVQVRNRLHEQFQIDPPPGADWAVKGHGDTLSDMARSVFCVAPPGWVGHTGRYWRTIQRGCIPISFFRAYDLAFQDLLDFSSFTVNIQPDHVGDLTPRINALVANPDRLDEMRVKLEDAQQQLSWERSRPVSGVEKLLYDMLDRRAETVSALLLHRANASR